MKPPRLLLAVAMAFALVPGAPRTGASDAPPARKPHDLESTLEVQERRAWDAFVKRDAQAFLEVMSTDSWVIDSNGFTNAGNIGETMNAVELHTYSLSDMRVLSL